MSRPRIRALVLAAGLGTRLRPLTLELPKPLLPVCGEAVAWRTLTALQQAGCETAALNLHHLPEMVSAGLGEACADMPLTYSEEPRILGTGGALYPLRSQLRQADVVVIANGDALAKWPLASLLKLHRRQQSRATLLLHRRVDPGPFGGGVGVDRKGRVTQLRTMEPVGEVSRRLVFTGLQLLDPSLLDQLVEGPGDLVADLYIPMLQAGERIVAGLTSRAWHDLGTPQRYLDAVLSWAGRRPWLSPAAEVDESAQLRRSVVEAEVRIGAQAELEGSLVLPGAVVGSGARLRRTLIGPGAKIPESAGLEGCMVTTLRPGYRAAPHESVLGGLVITPIDGPGPLPHSGTDDPGTAAPLR